MRSATRLLKNWSDPRVGVLRPWARRNPETEDTGEDKGFPGVLGVASSLHDPGPGAYRACLSCREARTQPST